MEAGLKLKSSREKLGLRYREVEQASNQIAQRLRNTDFVIGLSRLADIENKGVVPNLHRLYSLCAIYRLDLEEVLRWYGINMEEIWRDLFQLKPGKNHLLATREPRRGSVSLPLQLDPGVDLERTTFLSRVVREWGPVPLTLLQNLDLDSYRYGFVGSEERRMYPLLQPGALLQIDDSRREIADGGWANEFERPIYFLELRDRYACCWCSVSGGHLVLESHPSSGVPPEVVRFPQDAEVIGQVVGVAMQLPAFNRERRPPRRSARSAAGQG